MPEEKDYIGGLHSYLKENFGGDFKLTPEQFKSKLSSDSAYANQLHGYLKENFGEDFKLDTKEFQGKVGYSELKTSATPSFSTDIKNTNTLPVIKDSPLQANVAETVIPSTPKPLSREGKASAIGAFEKNTQDLKNSDVNLNSFYIGVGKTDLIPDATIKAQMKQEEAELNATRAQYKNKTDLSYKELVPVMNSISGFYVKDQSTINFLSKTNESGDRVADPIKVDEQAKAIARQYGVPEDGYFKNLIYEDLKSKIDYSYKEKDIAKQADVLSVKQFGKPLNELVNEDFQKNFKAEKEIKATAELQAKALATQITSENNRTQQEISNSYEPIIKETNGVYEQQSKSIAADLDTKLNGISDAYKAGLMDYETYTNEFNTTKQQATQLGEQVHAEYLKNFQVVSSEYLTKLKESAGKYDARYKRQLDEIDRISNSRLTEEAKKYSASYKMSPEMAAKYKKVWEEASVKVGAKYEEYNFLRDKAKGRIDLSIQSLTSGLGTGIKGISSFMDFEEGKLFGDVLSTSNTLSSANIGGAKDLLDLTKVIRSSGEMIGGMTPMLAANAIAAMATQGTSIPTQMMLLGGLGWSLETMQMAGDTRNEVFTRTGSLEDADNAAKKIITGQLALIPLYGLSGLPFIGKATLGIKNAGARMLAKGGVEVLEEIPQEFFQSSIEDIAKENKELSEIGEKLTLERLKSTALNVAPSTFLMGAAPSSFTLAKDSWAKMEAKAYGAKQDISRLSPTGLQQFMYEITLRHGEAFAKSYLVGLEQTNKIDAIQLDELNRAIDMVKPTVETTKKFGFTEGKSKVYASILFDYQKVLANIDTEADPIAKKALETKAKELEAAASDFLNTGTADYAIMHLPNGEQYLATYSQVQNWLNDERFANRLMNGSIDITIETSKDKSTAKLLQGVIADLKTQKPKPSEKLSLTENIKQNTEKSQEQLEADKERVSEIQSILASDNLSMQEQGVGNLIPEARQKLTAELEQLNAEQEIIPATEAPAAPTSGISGEVQESGDVTTAETSERVVYDREPTANDGVYKILGDLNNIIYRVNPATGRIQEFSDGLWSNTASNAIARGTARKQGFQKIKDPSNAEQLTNKQNEKDSKQSTNEANGQVVLEGVRETGNENESGKDSEQLREEEVADLEKIRKEIKSKYKLEIISKGNGFHLLRNGKTISIFNTLQEAEQVLENRIDDLVNAVITQPIDLGDNISVNGITVDGVTYSVLNVSERMVTIVNIGGVNVPFYLTTGLGGKNLTPSWYPMFGYSQSGWLNKTDGKDMEAYYERLIGKEAADVLKKTAEKLNKQFGTTPNSIKQTGILTGEQTYEAVNSVLNFTTAENQKIDASVNAKEELVKLENNIKSIGKEINAKYDAELAELKAKQAKETTKSIAEQEVTKKTTKVTPKEGDTSITKSARGMIQNMVFKDGEWQIKFGKDFTKVAKSAQQEAQDYFNEKNAPVAEAKEQAPVVKEQAAPPVKAEEKEDKEQKEPVKEQAPVIETPVIEVPKLEIPVVEETVTENEPTVEEEEEQYEPITVSDTSHDTFTKDNAVDYEEGEKYGDNGRSYSYLASVTVELIDDVSGDSIGTISKLKDEDGEITWNAENNDGYLVAEEASSKSEAQQALVDNYNKQKLKEFNKEKAKAAKEKIKEAEKAKQKAEKEAAKAAKAAEKAKPVQTEKEKAKEKAKEALKERKTKKDEAVNITNKSSLEELENNNKNNQLKTKIIAQAKKAVLALKSILPNFDIYIHDTVEGYNEQMEEVNGVKNSVGNFAYSNIDGNYVGRIDINLNTANLRTVAHEVSHAVMLVAFGENPLLFKSFRNKISDILSTETNKKLTEFADRYRDNPDVIDEEYLVELSAVLSETKGKMKLSTLSRIAIKVNEIVSKLTNGKIVVFDDIRNTNDIIEFFNSFSEGITKGADIQKIIKDYSGTLYEPTGLNIKGTISEPLPTTGRAPKSKASRGEFDLVPHPIIDKNMMVNKKYSVTMSDHTKVGEYKNDKTNVNIKNLMGGVFFPYIKGIRDAGLAWASVTTKAAREMVLNAANQDYTLIYRMARSTGSRGNVNFNEIAFAELTAPVNNGKVTEKELLKKLNDKLNTVSKGKQLGAGKYILDKLGVDTNETLTVNKTETVKEQNAKGKLVNKVKNILDKEGNNVLVEITKKEIPSLDALKIGLMKESFGKRGGFWSVVLKDSYSKKSTGEWYKFLEKYEVTSIEDIVNNLAEPEVDSAKDHDVVGAIKIAPPEYDERGNVKIYTTRKSLVNEAKGVYFIDAPDHPSYPYVVKGEPVGIFNEFNQITDYFPVISKWIKSKRLNSPYKAVETMGKELVETLDPTKVKLKSKSQIVEPTSDAWTPSLTEKEVNDVTNGAYTENLDKRELEGTAHATQVATTKGTYIKWANWLKDNMPNIKNARVLDVGAGFGHIHKPFKQILGIEAESYEPFYNKQKYLLHAGKAKPDYLKMDASDVPKGKFDVVVNNAVLNVVPADIRDNVVRTIGESIKNGGIGIISAMNFDYTKGQINKINEGKSKNIKLSDSEVFTYESGKYTYQKGFKTPEIVAYVQDVLGDDYVVSAAPSGLKQMATVLIKKIAETEPSKGMKSKAQVDVWHGSPYSFDKFTTEKIGTGEGAQAFGWGLYFTDLKDIAENYAKKLSQIFVDGKTLEDYLYDEGVKLYNIDFSKINSQSTKNNALNEIDRQIKENQKDIDYYENLIDEGVETGETQVQIDFYKYKLDNLIYNDKSLHDAYNAIFRSKKYEADENTRNLYKVSLHEGKTPDQYTWLEWDKPLSEKQKEKIINQIEKENSNPEKTPFTSSTSFLTEKINSTKKGGQLYAELTNLIYGDKNASEFLLRSGIDGIKYPAESIARGVTSDTARGSNYVVFDENAVTINTISKAQKNNQAENIDQDLVDTIIDIKAEGLLDDKDIIDTFTEDGEYSKEQVQAALDFIKEPTENEPAATITENEAEFTPNAKDIAVFKKILEGTTSDAIRINNATKEAKSNPDFNPKILEIMSNFKELKKQLMASVELTEDCSW